MRRGTASGRATRTVEPIAVIDLDVRGEPPAGSRPGPAGRHRRAAALTACLAAVLGLVVGSAGPADPDFRLVATIPIPRGGGSMAVAGDLALLGGGDGTVAAFDLASGRRRWTAPGIAAITDPAPGLVLVYDVVTPSARSITRVVRADTGAVVWAMEGPVNVGAGGRIVWTTVTPPAAVEAVERPLGSPVGIEVRELASGRPLWSTRPEWTTISEDPSGAFVLVRPAGDVEVRDPLTGSVLRTGRLPGDLDPAGAALLPLGGSLVVVDYRARRVIGLDPATFRTRWARVADGVVPCGEVVCVADIGVGMAGVDPTTGAVRWTTKSANMLRVFGRGIMMGDSPWRPTRVVDAATGDTVVDLTAWDDTPWSEGAGLLVLGRVWPHRDRTTVALLAPGWSAPRLLGLLPRAVHECRAGRGRVVCLTDDDEFGIWAYRAE
jgi:outer membrane protein assembly factor BamB